MDKFDSLYNSAAYPGAEHCVAVPTWTARVIRAARNVIHWVHSTEQADTIWEREMRADGRVFFTGLFLRVY